MPRHGGSPVGSISQSDQCTELLPSCLPALLFDCTHDNVTPAQKRHPVDALSSAALVSAAVCAVGSTRGYDIFVPENPSVVFEFRPYTPLPPLLSGRSPVASGSTGSLPTVITALTASGAPVVGDGDVAGGMGSVGLTVRKGMGAPMPGMTRARRVLNNLHKLLAAEGFTEIHVNHDVVDNGDIVTVQRSHPTRADSYVFIVRTAFSPGEARGKREAEGSSRKGFAALCVLSVVRAWLAVQARAAPAARRGDAIVFASFAFLPFLVVPTVRV